MAAISQRRWLQFSLKGMLVVMTLACVGLGWLAYGRNEVAKREEAIAVIRKLGGRVVVDESQRSSPAWLSLLLGEKTVGEVVAAFCPNFSDKELAHIASLTKIKRVNLQYSQVTDAGLTHLAKLTSLEGLWLQGTRVSDEGLVHLVGLTKLRQLHVNRTQVTKDGASQLMERLPSLQILR